MPPTFNPSNIVSANSPTLINQLKDWQLRQNNLIIYNIPETELVNQQDIKTELLSKFKELITDKCNVTIKTNNIVSIQRLGSKSDTDPKISIDRTIEERNDY